MRLLGSLRMDEVVDVGVAAQPVATGQRVVAHADHFVRFEADALGPAREFRRLDELGVVMSSAWQHLEDVFGADDCEQVRFRVAIEGREKNVAAGFYEAPFPSVENP